jgi:hypothetical protein
MGPEPISADDTEEGATTIAFATTAVVMGSRLGLRPPRKDGVVPSRAEMV